jgi:endonuclease/exonuclease/phosphatase family metal-dependent hydrolase
MWQGRLARNIRPFFEAQDVDILCLQELNNSFVPIADWLETFQSLKVVKEATGLTDEYYSPTLSYDIMDVEVAFGNGILSRYALSDQQTIFTNGSYAKITKASDQISNTRNAQIVTIQTPEGKVTIVNTHAHWDKNPMGSELSVERLEILANALKDVEGPIIVAGDFNVSSESQAIQSFKKTLGLTDLTSEHGITNTLNNLVTPFKVACDHIFINEAIEVTDFRVDETLLSDHKILVLEFNINK